MAIADRHVVIVQEGLGDVAAMPAVADLGQDVLSVVVFVQEAVIPDPVVLRPVGAVGAVGVGAPARWASVGARWTFIPSGCGAAEVAVFKAVGAVVAFFNLPPVAVAGGAIVAVNATLVHTEREGQGEEKTNGQRR